MSTDLRGLLLDVARLYADLEDGLHGTRSGRAEGGTGTKVEAPLPLDADVAEHRHLLLRGLRYWASRFGSADYGATTDSVPHLVAWIVHHLDHLTADERIELATNLSDWKSGAAGRMDLPTLRGSLHLGDCPNKAAAEWTCAGALRVMLPADKARSPWLSCTACKTRWNVTDLPAAADVRLPLSALAELCKVSVRTLQWRAQMGHLESAGGYARLGDVLRSECAETGIVPV